MMDVNICTISRTHHNVNIKCINKTIQRKYITTRLMKEDSSRANCISYMTLWILFEYWLKYESACLCRYDSLSNFLKHSSIITRACLCRYDSSFLISKKIKAYIEILPKALFSY